MNRKIVLFLIAFPSPLLWGGAGGEVFSQDTIDNATEQKLENLAEASQNEDDDYTSLLEILTFYKSNPINLNHTNAAQLSELGLLDEIQIANLLTHLERNGKLISIYELQSIDGFPVHVIEKLQPYITLTDKKEESRTGIKDILKNSRHEFIFRAQQVLEEQTGYSPVDSTGINENPNSRYIGSPQKIHTRYRFRYQNKISAGITGEKDPGELFFRNNNPYNYPHYDSLLNGKQKDGFDFYSAHLFIRNEGFVKALALGDYQVGFGQGVTSWSSMAYGKSSDALNIDKHASGIRPYTSTDENRFMRGAAATIGSDALQTTAFFSRKKVDANATYTDSTETTAVYTLQSTGLHSTPAELQDKDALTETIFGGNVSFKKKKYSIGLTGMHSIFDGNVTHSNAIYNQFTFSGNELTNIGMDYSFVVRNFYFFGEASSSRPGPEGRNSLAVVNGCVVKLDPKISLSLLQRTYQKDFKTLSSNSFAESSGSNEQGIYLGISARPSKTLTINAYYDHFKFPWLKYQVNAPSSGNEYLAQINYSPSKTVETYFRFRQKDKFVNSSSPDELDFITPFLQTSYRWHISYRTSHSLKLSNRIEFIKAGDETGYLIYQDVSYGKPKGKLALTFRYALFDTKSFESRIYAYESDIPGAFSIPSYYYKGSRIYAMLNYNITKNIEFWVRWSQTYYLNQSTISSGTPNEINGRSKSEVKAELRLRL